MAILSSQQCEKLDVWLAESGELYVCIYNVHGGGSGKAYFCRAVTEIEALLSAQTWPEIVVHIFRRIQYSLRGIADETLLAQALHQIPDGKWFRLVSLDECFPLECGWRGEGNSHAEMREDFSNIIGQRIGIGFDPFDSDDEWTYTRPDEVMVLNVKMHSDWQAYTRH